MHRCISILYEYSRRTGPSFMYHPPGHDCCTYPRRRNNITVHTRNGRTQYSDPCFTCITLLSTLARPCAASAWPNVFLQGLQKLNHELPASMLRSGRHHVVGDRGLFQNADRARDSQDKVLSSYLSSSECRAMPKHARRSRMHAFRISRGIQ